MRRICAILTLFAGELLAAPVAAQTPTSVPIVEVGVFNTLPDGTVNMSGYATGDHASAPLRSAISLGACSVSLGGGPGTPRGGARRGSAAPAPAIDGWRIDGQVLSLTGDEAVIELNWQRTLSNGQPSTGPGGPIHLSLRPGERVPLDVVDKASSGFCQVGGTLAFEARFVLRPSTAEGRPAGSPGGGRSGTAPRGPTGSEIFDVELWLIHSIPSRPDEVLHEMIQAVETTPFHFASINIPTAQGNLTVAVSGSIAITRAADGKKQLIFSADRKTSFAPANRAARDQPPQPEGGTKVTVPLPGPSDVLSFEMPALRLRETGALLSDQFAIRVRISPTK